MPDGCNEELKVNAFSGTGHRVTEIIMHGSWLRRKVTKGKEQWLDRSQAVTERTPAPEHPCPLALNNSSKTHQFGSQEKSCYKSYV